MPTMCVTSRVLPAARSRVVGSAGYLSWLSRIPSSSGERPRLLALVCAVDNPPRRRAAMSPGHPDTKPQAGIRLPLRRGNAVATRAGLSSIDSMCWKCWVWCRLADVAGWNPNSIITPSISAVVVLVALLDDFALIQNAILHHAPPFIANLFPSHASATSPASSPATGSHLS